MAADRLSPLLAVVGETASGKSALALQIAQRFNGEIICADSATVRRGFDIGTAKPSKKDQALVRHHLLDIVDPNQRFTVADFQRLAMHAMNDIKRRGKLPIMVGGTGLYIDSVLFNYQFGINSNLDRQHMRPNTLVYGIKLGRELLKHRVEQRVDEMLKDGLENEVRQLTAENGQDCLAQKNVGYAQWRGYLNGTQSLVETRQLIIKATLDLAKRQRTWFKRNNSIQWLVTPVNMANIVAGVTTFLNT